MKGKQYYQDLIGQKFHRLTIVEHLAPHKRKNGRHYSMVKCVCDCGKEVEAPLTCVLTRYKSCGCYGIDNPSHLRHNMSKDRLFHIWSGMKHRCDDAEHPAYADYGGRGISYCKEWSISDNFFAWAKESGYEPHLTLDRFPDMNGNYEPSNCRWATQKQQCRNTRRSIMITRGDETKSLPEWCEVLNFGYIMAYKRIKRGWALADIFN